MQLVGGLEPQKRLLSTNLIDTVVTSVVLCCILTLIFHTRDFACVHAIISVSQSEFSGSNRTPHALQWAVRNLQRQGGSVEANSHGYGATANIRRGGSGASASADVSNGGNHLYSMPSALARTFAIVVREVLPL